MNNKNSQIRARARQLLDDNIFGKDWSKSALINILMFIIIMLTGGILFDFSSNILEPLFILIFEGKSVILSKGIAVVFDLVNILLLNILIGPISVGIAAVHTDLVGNGGEIKISKFLHGFNDFANNFVLGVMYTVQVILWSLMLVIPGIYISYSYALVFHIKNDHPQYDWKKCFDESERLMDGNRFRLFKLQISHLGWVIVGFAFVLIGAFWALPYLQTSTAIFYEEIKNKRP